MADDIINLDAERNRRVDWGSVRLDAQGLELIEFVASYDVGDGTRRSVPVWAYSRADAGRQVESMRSTLQLEGAAWEFEPVNVRPE